jgi:hypothetical protein
MGHGPNALFTIQQALLLFNSKLYINMVWPLFDPILTACSFGWWLMAGADLF